MSPKINKIDKELIRESIFIIGHVLSVDGRVVTVKVNKNKNHSHVVYEGRVVKNVSVGSYVKIVKGFINIIGKVEGESVVEEKYFNRQYNKEETKINRTLQVSLFGHFENDSFKQGIKEMPLVDNECYLLDRDEFNTLHQFYKDGTKTITIGCLTDEPAQKIKLSVNKLFASHIGIFGNTGSGKSNTLAKIYTSLFEECDIGSFREKSKFVIIDFNGEYVEQEVISESKDVYILSTIKTGSRPKYPVLKEHIENPEILSVLLEATEKTQKPFLNRALKKDFLESVVNYNQDIIDQVCEIFEGTVRKLENNTHIFHEFFKYMQQLINETDELKELVKSFTNNLTWHTIHKCYMYTYQGQTLYSNQGPQADQIVGIIKTIVEKFSFKTDAFTKLKIKIILNYYYEVVKGFSNSEHIQPLIGRMFKKFSMLERLIEINTAITEKTNLIVISLRDVNTEMKKTLPLLICKQLYDEKKLAADRARSLHIIIDEAHNILSTMSQRESETWRDYRLETFEEIIKEGRKFGTFLTIASQRPYDISPTIISQLHNYFLHRLINDNDIQAISKTVAYLDKLSFQTIPILSVGSCFIAGLASDIPVKVDIEFLAKSKQPKSETINLEQAWNLGKNTQEQI